MDRKTASGWARTRDRARGWGLRLAAAVLLAACGTPQPATPSASPSTSGASPTPAPSVAASGAALPTAEAAEVAHIAVVSCPVEPASAGPSAGPLPSTMTATVTAAVAAQVTFYAGGDLTILGPKGWSCAASVAADGTSRMAITPPQRPLAPAPATPAPDAQAVTAVSAAACTDCIVRMTCAFFPEAVRLGSGSCPVTIPAGEGIRRSMPRAIIFDDPPGVAGSGEPSGGTERALGFVVFDPGPSAGGSQVGPRALKVTCTLPSSMAAICDEIVEQR